MDIKKLFIESGLDLKGLTNTQEELLLENLAQIFSERFVIKIATVVDEDILSKATALLKDNDPEAFAVVSDALTDTDIDTIVKDIAEEVVAEYNFIK